jgi:cytochrome b
MNTPSASRADRVLVWDLPVRLFQWLLAASFAGAYLTSESERWRQVHVVFGYTVAGLIAFRVLWGFVGGRYARFSEFVRGPSAAYDYVKSLLTGRPQHYTGHNPAGALAIVALLALGALAALSGYATYNDFGGEWLEEVHEALANTMLALVVLHLAGVLVGSIAHGENLVRAMLTGRKRRAD